MQTIIAIQTSGPGLHEFTEQVLRFVRDSGVQQGLLTLFVQHTSCSLCVQENADPDVVHDILLWLNQLSRKVRIDIAGVGQMGEKRTYSGDSRRRGEKSSSSRPGCPARLSGTEASA